MKLQLIFDTQDVESRNKVTLHILPFHSRPSCFLWGFFLFNNPLSLCVSLQYHQIWHIYLSAPVPVWADQAGGQRLLPVHRTHAGECGSCPLWRSVNFSSVFLSTIIMCLQTVVFVLHTETPSKPLSFWALPTCRGLARLLRLLWTLCYWDSSYP